MPSKSLSLRDYSVGWICALDIELVAAKSMLDARHTLPQISRGDSNSYTLGEIAGHNVVIACLPAGHMGNNSSATVAAHLRSTFQEIRHGLMVGIGGGVPSDKHDIRLGDVVVSQPGKRHGGVVQYDFGRTVANGRFEPNGSLNAPPTTLLTAISTLKANHTLLVDAPLKHYSSAMEHNSLGPSFEHQGVENDLLFQADYDHISGDGDCENCDRTKLISRATRLTPLPIVHYGTIASGNQVMRHGGTREKVRTELDVLCFEMEAAGFMNELPCLVIRGICDYSDTHKCKPWQGYAAMTAAAYAKELLSVIAAGSVRAEKTVLGLSTSSNNNTHLEHPPNDDPDLFLVLSKQSDWRLVQSEGLPYFNIFENLSDYEWERTHLGYFRERCPDTTMWILQDARYLTWLEEKRPRCLWLTGKIGCGKTLLTSTMVEHLLRRCKHAGTFVGHFFFSHSNTSHLKSACLFQSYIKQILGHLSTQHISVPQRVRSWIIRLFGRQGSHYTIDELITEILIPLTELLPGVIFVVDGLDECEPKEIKDTLKAFNGIGSSVGPKLLISGRESLNVSNSIQDSAMLKITNNISKDIETFIDWKIVEKLRERQITDDESIILLIKKKLIEQADQMILWVSLQINEIWEECETTGDILPALANMPKDLNEIYGRCLSRMKARNFSLARKALPWVCASTRPFKESELLEAVAVDSNTGLLDRSKMPTVSELLNSCSNFITRNSNGQIILIHYSVRQFLESSYHQFHIRSAELNGHPFESFKLDLATICIAHLTSSDYALRVESYRPRRSVQFNTSAVLQTVTREFGWKLPFLGRSASRDPRLVALHSPQTSLTANQLNLLPPFFFLARDQWAPLTDEVDKRSPVWQSFRNLALQPNLSYNLHPWQPLGTSLNSHYSGLLGWAVLNHHLPLLKVLIEEKNQGVRREIFDMPVFAQDDLAKTGNLPPLHTAARGGRLAMVKALTQVCQVGSVDKTGRSALHHAAELGHLDVVKELIACRIYLTAIDNHGMKPIDYARRGQHVPVIVHLAQEEDQINRMSPTLTQSLDENNQDLVLAVLYTSYHSASDTTLVTAFKYAMRYGNELIINRLVELGVDVNCRSDSDNTYLHLAASVNQWRLLEKLVELGIGADTRSVHRAETPLHKAAIFGSHEAIRTLVGLGACLNLQDKDGLTPLHFAASYGDHATASILLDLGASADCRDGSGMTPLYRAVVREGDDDRLIRLLARLGASVDLQDCRGQAPFHRVARRGNIMKARMLLELGASIELEDSHGNTALHHAAENGHHDIVKFLIQSGADYHRRNKSGCSALICAEIAGHQKVVKIIRRHRESLQSGRTRSISPKPSF